MDKKKFEKIAKKLKGEFEKSVKKLTVSKIDVNRITVGESRAINAFRVGDYFYLNEFQCPCCHTVKLVPYLVWMLDKLRKRINAPIIVTSGYRCPKHNKEVGGAKNSYHMKGMAADIYSENYSPDELGKYADEIVFDTIIVHPGKGFVHLDIRPYGLGLVWRKK